MRRAAHLALVFLAALWVGALLAAAHATLQEDSCIEPDVEYPVPCDDDDD